MYRTIEIQQRVVDRTIVVRVAFPTCLVKWVSCAGVLVGGVVMIMFSVIRVCACVVDATGFWCRETKAFACAVVQMPDQMHTGSELAVTQRYNEQDMYEFSAIHSGIIVVSLMPCQTNRSVEAQSSELTVLSNFIEKTT